MVAPANDPPAGDNAHVPALVAGRSRPDEQALARTFASLLEPVELGPTGASRGQLATKTARRDVEEYPEGVYVQVAALLGARRMAQAALLLRRLDAVIDRHTDRPRWKRRTAFLWAVYAQQTADVPGVLEHCISARESGGDLLPSDCRCDELFGSCLSRTIDAVVADQLPLLTARAHIGLGQPESAEAVLLEKYGDREQAEASQPALMAMLASCQGRLADAIRLATAALQAAQRQDTTTELVDLEARLVLAEVFVERDQLDAAWQQLQAALRLYWLGGATSCMWAVEIDLARVLVARGRAGEALHRLEYLGAEAAGFLSQPLLQKLNQLSIECRLELGDPEGALLIAESNLPQDIPRETLARLDLCSGRPDRALARLDTHRSSNLAVEIRRLVLRACAEKQQGRVDQAHDTIRRAVDTARPERYVRPFLEQSAHTLPLLRGLREFSQDSFLSELICAAERLASTPLTGKHATVLEPLTARERQILRYLPSHLTLRQVGLAMCLSTNTVKTHVKAIYRKIGAISRDDAVTIARQHGLL